MKGSVSKSSSAPLKVHSLISKLRETKICPLDLPEIWARKSRTPGGVQKRLFKKRVLIFRPGP